MNSKYSNIRGISKNSERNAKIYRKYLKKKISYRNVNGKCSINGSREHCWIWQMKAFYGLELFFSAHLSKNMHPYPNTKHSDMLFMLKKRKEMHFKGNEAAAQKIAWNNPGYNMPDWPTFERLHQELCMCPSFYTSKHDSVTERYFWICWVWSISLRSPIHEMHVGEFRIHLTMHVAWNPCREWKFKSSKRFHFPASTGP